MRIVIVLGGNALLRRGEPLTAANQCGNVRIATEALAPLVLDQELIINHGNVPRLDPLVLQGAVLRSEEPFPLDILDAETEAMIGDLIEQELTNLLPGGRQCQPCLPRQRWSRGIRPSSTHRSGLPPGRGRAAGALKAVA
jgi:carbamate kinase